jgi:membrane protease YdiL (CAAX protease family)
LAAVIPAMLLPSLGALLYFIIFAGNSTSPTIYGLVKIIMVAWPLAVCWRWGWPPSIATTRRSLPLCLAEGLAAGLLMGGAILVLALGPWSPLLAIAAPRIVEKVADFHLAAPAAYLAASLGISLVHSAFEEYYWRWFVYGQLQLRLADGWAHALAGLAFALHHIVIASVYCGPVRGLGLGLVVGAAGACWSLLYRRHGSILGAWLAHVGCDLALMYLGWRVLTGQG